MSLAALLVTCRKPEKKASLPDSIKADTTYERLDRWLDYHNLALGDFVDSMPIAERNSIEFDYDFFSDSANLFKEFFIFSPDSLKYIDLDSYSIVLEKDSQGQLFSGGSEADTEVALIDIKKKKRIRVLFCGTACWAEEAQWIKNDVVYIMGFMNVDDMNYPTLWTYEINNNLFQGFKTKDSIDLTGKNYVSETRLTKISFQ